MKIKEQSTFTYRYLEMRILLFYHVINLINTDDKESKDVIQIAKEVCIERKIRDVIVASTKGTTGLAEAKMFKDLNVNVVVAHSVGFRDANTNEFPPEIEA